MSMIQMFSAIIEPIDNIFYTKIMLSIYTNVLVDILWNNKSTLRRKYSILLGIYRLTYYQHQDVLFTRLEISYYISLLHIKDGSVNKFHKALIKRFQIIFKVR